MNLKPKYNKIIKINAGESITNYIPTHLATGISYSLELGSGWINDAILVVKGYNEKFARWEILSYLENDEVKVLKLLS